MSYRRSTNRTVLVREVFPPPEHERPIGTLPATSDAWDTGIKFHTYATAVVLRDYARLAVTYECLKTHVSDDWNQPGRDQGRFWRRLPYRLRTPPSDDSEASSTLSVPLQQQVPSPSPYASSSPIPVPQSPSQRRGSHSQHSRPLPAGLYAGAQPASAPSPNSSYVLDSPVHPHGTPQASLPRAHQGRRPSRDGSVLPGRRQSLDYGGGHAYGS
ncbi:hypothetical protein K488DRAFT_71475 [Vararia minispora EC-137]|uniref:Uncharacterized protein n=1 Tax=Vararia minispora EC-137 TaxID=1314806 RepID=A0ACB8QHT1_9AGAM|nr:hypothetical protein K488DRAFT_71475 [Vararia minispora EC-137]